MVKIQLGFKLKNIIFGNNSQKIILESESVEHNGENFIIEEKSTLKQKLKKTTRIEIPLWQKKKLQTSCC